MIIIFEGNENTGKTNIGVELAKQLNCLYFKSSNELHCQEFGDEKIDYEEAAKHDWRFFLDFYTQLNNFKPQHVVIDRSFISEYVYGNTLRPANMSESVKKHLYNYANIISKMDHLVVHCHKDKHYEDDIVDMKFMPAIDIFYEDFYSKTHMSVLRLDTTDCNLENQIGYIRTIVGDKK